MADADIFFASPDTGTAGTFTHAQNIDNGGGTNVYLKGSFQGFFGTAGSMNQSAFSAYSGAMFGTCQYGNGATFTYTTPGGGYSLLYTPDGFNLTQSALDAEINNIGAPLWTSAAASAAQQATNGLTINSNQISGPINAGQIQGLPGGGNAWATNIFLVQPTNFYCRTATPTNSSLSVTLPAGTWKIEFYEFLSNVNGTGGGYNVGFLNFSNTVFAAFPVLDQDNGVYGGSFSQEEAYPNNVTATPAFSVSNGATFTHHWGSGVVKATSAFTPTVMFGFNSGQMTNMIWAGSYLNCTRLAP